MVSAGGHRELFTSDAKQFIYRESQGIPRIINTLCDMALVYGYASRQRRITGRTVVEVLADRDDFGILPGEEAEEEPRKDKKKDKTRPVRRVSAGK